MDVRKGLASRGITISEDTWFLGALHDTTTDEVRIFDEATVPQALTTDLARLKDALSRAASLARLASTYAAGFRASTPIFPYFA